jgi:hypothetical protein
MDFSQNLSSNPYSAPSFTSGAKSSRSAKELVATSGAKVSAVSGLDYMKRNEFKRAAQHFISVSYFSSSSNLFL